MLAVKVKVMANVMRETDSSSHEEVSTLLLYEGGAE